MQFHSTQGSRSIRIFRITAVLAAAVLAWFFWNEPLRRLISILFGGAVFAFLLAPVCRILEKRLPRPAAALVALIGSALLLAALAALALPLFARQLASFADLLPGAVLRIKQLLDAAGARLQQWMPEIRLPELDPAFLKDGLGGAAQQAASIVSSAADGVYRLFLMAALSYFLLSDRQNILLRLELLVPMGWRRLAVRAGGMLMTELRLYLRGQMTISLAVGLLAGLGLAFMGLENALLLGIFVGIFNLIPYFGPLLGGIPAVITALSAGWQKAAMTVLMLFLVQQMDGMVISPRIMGNITGFSPAIVLLAIFIGANAGGIGGMLFALPSLMTIRTLYRVFVQHHEKN